MGGYPSFIESEVVGDIFINESEFGSNKEINNAINYGFPIFEDCELNGELYIRNSKIGDPATQEKVFRKAKLIRENLGIAKKQIIATILKWRPKETKASICSIS